MQMEDYILATKQACKMLPVPEGEQLRAQVTRFLNQAKPPKCNIFTARRLAERGICRLRVCVCHTPVLYQNG